MLTKAINNNNSAQSSRVVRKVASQNSEINSVITKAVKKALERETETKWFVYAGQNYLFNAGTLITSVYALGAGTWPLSPYTGYVGLAQGNTQGTRVGNKVTTRRAMLDLVFRPKIYDATYNPTPMPFIVKIWIWRNRNNSSSSEMQNAINGYFLDSNASDVGLVGSISDLVLKFNKDALQLLHTEEFKIGYAINGGTGSSAAAQSQTNNDFKLFEHIRRDITSFLHKDYVFNDNDQLPLNHPTTWLTMEAVGIDGTTNVGIRPGEMTIAIDYEYTDS